MGASLPLLSRAVATSLDTVAERIGRLYGLNTLGAGLGALLGGWLVLGILGFVGALLLAAGLELLAAALALTLLPACARRAGSAAPAAAAAGAADRQTAEPFGGLRLWCLLVFLSGYVIVALEIVWVRLARARSGSSTPTCSRPCSACSCWPTGSAWRWPRARPRLRGPAPGLLPRPGRRASCWPRR